MMPRVFLGVPTASAALTSALDELAHEPGLRPVRKDGLHLTLRFIGTVSDTLCAALERELARITLPAAFDVPLTGFASFSDSVLYAAAAPSALLVSVLAAADALIDGVPNEDGMLDPVKAERTSRAYVPHVTLARAKDAAGQARTQELCAQHQKRDLGALRVSSVTLFASVSVPGERNRYVTLANRPLPGA